MIDQLDSSTYSQPIPALSNASIGQHIRHIIEVFKELENGYVLGEVDYELRKRDFDLENNPEMAVSCLRKIGVEVEKDDKSLLLVSDYNEMLSEKTLLPTTYYRELIYNIEHTVHHMALIRIGWNQIWDRPLPSDFGVAVSTRRYRERVNVKF